MAIHQELPPLGETANIAPILIVDDDFHLRQMIQWLLEDEGFVVTTAADGQDAVKQAKAQRPRLVVLDIGLPLLDGLEVAKALRALYGLQIPIVFITAGMYAPEKRLQIGAISFLQKPFEIDDLVRLVHQGLQE